jgi:hypothetical protein
LACKGGEQRGANRWMCLSTSPLLMGAEVPVVDNARCDERGDPGSHLCRVLAADPVDACAGDSGGPLMVRDERGYVQVGLVSGGTLCVDDGERFSTYTRVSAYEDWIRATMAGETEVADLRVYPDFSLPATFYADEQIVTGFTPDPIDYPACRPAAICEAERCRWRLLSPVSSPRRPMCASPMRRATQYPLRFFVEGQRRYDAADQPARWPPGCCNDDRVEGDLNPEIVFRPALDRPVRHLGRYLPAYRCVGRFSAGDTAGERAGLTQGQNRSEELIGPLCPNLLTSEDLDSIVKWPQAARHHTSLNG